MFDSVHIKNQSAERELELDPSNQALSAELVHRGGCEMALKAPVPPGWDSPMRARRGIDLANPSGARRRRRSAQPLIRLLLLA